MIRRQLLAALLAAPLVAPFVAQAAGYPDRPITLVHGFSAGGNADVVARIIALPLSKELGQSIIVDPKAGAGGNLASGQVAKAPADGYTLILHTGGHAVSAAMMKKQPFDPLESFDWISVVTTFPLVLAVSSESKFRNIKDVLSAAKAAPGTISFSSVGIGSTQHLSGELFQSAAGVELIHIPYKGGAAPLQDVLGGRVDLMFDSVTVTRPHIESGKLRGLGVTSATRAPQLPNVPPVKDSVPGFEVTSWLGVAAPKGLPPAVAQRLHEALVKVLTQPDVVKQLEATGGIASPSASSAEMKAFVQAQIGKWTKVVKDANIPMQ